MKTKLILSLFIILLSLIMISRADDSPEEPSEEEECDNNDFHHCTANTLRGACQSKAIGFLKPQKSDGALFKVFDTACRACGKDNRNTLRCFRDLHECPTSTCTTAPTYGTVCEVRGSELIEHKNECKIPVSKGCSYFVGKCPTSVREGCDCENVEFYKPPPSILRSGYAGVDMAAKDYYGNFFYPETINDPVVEDDSYHLHSITFVYNSNVGILGIQTHLSNGIDMIHNPRYGQFGSTLPTEDYVVPEGKKIDRVKMIGQDGVYVDGLQFRYSGETEFDPKIYGRVHPGFIEEEVPIEGEIVGIYGHIKDSWLRALGFEYFEPQP